MGEARALWDNVLAARREASVFRARTLDDCDHAYCGVSGQAPKQLNASRAELATKMLREDPAAFREMVFAGLRALEIASKQGTSREVEQSEDSKPNL
jgi:hypothetical protein